MWRTIALGDFLKGGSILKEDQKKGVGAPKIIAKCYICLNVEHISFFPVGLKILFLLWLGKPLNEALQAHVCTERSLKKSREECNLRIFQSNLGLEKLYRSKTLYCVTMF